MIGGIGCHAMTNDLLGGDVAHNLGTVHASSTIESAIDFLETRTGKSRGALRY